MTCVYHGCDKRGLYENFTLCRAHKNFNGTSSISEYTPNLPDRKALPKPIYCKKCDNKSKTLNCKNGYSGLENCKIRTHLCEKCDECICGIDSIKQEKISYYTKCGCFTYCTSCIYTMKRYE